MEKAERLAQLILKKNRGTISQDEEKELEMWKEESPANKRIADELNDPDLIDRTVQHWFEMDDESLDNKLDFINERIATEMHILGID